MTGFVGEATHPDARPPDHPATWPAFQVARAAAVSLPAVLASQLDGGMLGEELECEGLHAADLWIE